jgi:hypothetical protein
VRFKNQLVVPSSEELRKKILEEEHNSKLSINSGSNKMYHDLRPLYWWSNMKQDITNYDTECDTCGRVKVDHMHTPGILKPLPIPVWKWEDLSMDFIVGLPQTSKGHDSIGVIVDRLIKSAHFLLVSTKYLATDYYGMTSLASALAWWAAPLLGASSMRERSSKSVSRGSVRGMGSNAHGWPAWA